MKSPSSREPSTATEFADHSLGILHWVGADVVKVRVAYYCVLIPSIPGIDCFRELGAAPLVDTANVDPYIIEAIRGGAGACVFQLVESLPTSQSADF